MWMMISLPERKGERSVDDLREIQRLFQTNEMDPMARERARSRLMQAIAAEQPDTSHTGKTRSRPRRVPALALVAALAALAFVAPSLMSPSGTPASAADVLRQLAGRVQSGWESPANGQFIYTKTVGERWECQGGSCSIVDFVRESWIARDGSGRIREHVGGTRSDKTYPAGGLVFDDLSSALGEDHLANLRRYVESRVPDGVEPSDFGLFVTISDLLGETQVLPELRIALFRLAATLPGTRPLGETTDATGRPGVGVAYSDGAVSRQIIFDPGSALVIGVRNVATDPSSTTPPTPSEVSLGVVPGTSETYVDSGLVTSTEDRRPHIG
jgi:hypothetical protein